MKLSRLPHAFFDLADFFLLHMKEAGRLSVVCDFSDEREVMDVVQRVVKPRSLVNAVLEAPEIVRCVPWSYLLTVADDSSLR